jgi:hypothetical protein
MLFNVRRTEKQRSSRARNNLMNIFLLWKYVCLLALINAISSGWIESRLLIQRKLNIASSTTIIGQR